MKRVPVVKTSARLSPVALSRYAGLDLLPSAILLLGADCRVIHGNPAAENLTESSLKNLVGQSVHNVFTGGPEWELTLQDAHLVLGFGQAYFSSARTQHDVDTSNA